MKKKPHATAVEWDDSTILGPLKEWKDIEPPQSFAETPSYHAEAERQQKLLVETAVDAREQNAQAMTDERSLKKLIDAIVARGCDPKLLRDEWHLYLDPPEFEVVLAQMGMRLPASDEELAEAWDLLILTGGKIGQLKRAAGGADRGAPTTFGLTPARKYSPCSGFEAFGWIVAASRNIAPVGFLPTATARCLRAGVRTEGCAGRSFRDW